MREEPDGEKTSGLLGPGRGLFGRRRLPTQLGVALAGGPGLLASLPLGGLCHPQLGAQRLDLVGQFVGVGGCLGGGGLLIRGGH